MSVRIVDGILDFILPRLCVVCGVSGDFLCEVHRGTLRRIAGPVCSRCGLPQIQSDSPLAACASCQLDPPHYDAHRSLFLFDAVMKDLIHQLKYHAAFWVRHVFTPAIADFASCHPDAAGKDALLVPMPLHAQRLRERGFNQSALLTRFWQRVLHHPVAHDALRRVKQTPSQTGLSREERQKNLADAFYVPHPSRLADRHIILIDDVHTTGASLSAAAQALKQAGALRVDALTVAAVVLHG